MYISVVKLPVEDVDRAISFYVDKLGWEKTMDVPMGEDSRWVTIAPKGAQTALTLFKQPGVKAGGDSGYVIEVDDVYKTYEQLRDKVEFPEKPRTEPWGGFATFKDSEGNVHGMHSSAPAAVSAN